MKEATTTITRLTLTKEERPIRASWGHLWDYFGRQERKRGYCLLLMGDWSGYTSSQQRITHIDYAPKDLPEDYHGTVRFSDGTTMSVWVNKITRKEIVARKYKRHPMYEDLIRKLIKKGTGYYIVGED